MIYVITLYLLRRDFRLFTILIIPIITIKKIIVQTTISSPSPHCKAYCPAFQSPPCKKELDAINDYYGEWQQKYNIELVAVSVDDSRSAAKVPAMVKEKGWKYRVLLDPSKEFQTAANIQAVPHTFVLDQKGNIVFEHNGYTPGDELELEDLFKELTKK